MSEGNLDDRILESLLAKYVDDLIEGKNFITNKENVVVPCPEKLQQEFTRLINIVNLLYGNRPISAAEAEKKQETKRKVLQLVHKPTPDQKGG